MNIRKTINTKKDVELLNSCSQVEVLKWFVGKWKEVRENEID